MNALEAAYRDCRLITKREAKNFFYGFLTLPAHKRRAIYAAYAFCRLCDDATDNEAPLAEKLQALGDVRRRLASARLNDAEEPVFLALVDAAHTFHIPQQYFEDVITGVEMDLTKQRYDDFPELRTYCYHVASVVGLICLEIFGCQDPRAKEYATDLGMAMQLTNILRDVKEDLDRDRIYIPQDEIQRFGYSEQALRSELRNGAYLSLMRFQAQRARGYFHSGLRLLPLLSPRCRACPAVLAQVYSRVLKRMERNDFDVFNGRISLSKKEKLFVTAQTWLKSMLPYPQAT